MMHDIFWQFGFYEPSGNFQEYNIGEEGIAIVAFAQDGSGSNNANMMTPPDVQKPRMRMYIRNRYLSLRDKDLDCRIVIHDFSHGTSNRLAGGASNVDCLISDEPSGFGGIFLLQL
jgi:extracellular elastinolytic metalloproteinase